MNEKKKLRFITTIALIAIATVSASLAGAETKKESGVSKDCQAKPGLLIIAHGAPMAKWNEPVLNLEKQVIELLGDDSPFGEVKVSMMEFTKPTIADGIHTMEEAGCSRIIVVPLLIAPSSHSHWDVPALLGLYSDEEIEKELRSEGAEIVRSKLPITVTATLNQGDLIPEIMLDRVKESSKDPKNEAVVILAHGDEMTPPLWDKLMKRTMTYVCGKTGISYANYGFVHVGQTYDTNGVGIIAEAAASRKRVIVVGVYLSMGVDGMHKRYTKTFSMKGAVMPGLENPLEGLDIILSKDGLLPDKRVAKWIVDIAGREVSLQNY